MSMTRKDLLKDGFQALPNAIARSPKISGGAKQCYQALLSFMWGDETRTYPSQATIAEYMGCAVTTVARYLMELKKLSLITWTTRILPNGGNGVNDYEFLPIPDFTGTPTIKTMDDTNQEGQTPISSLRSERATDEGASNPSPTPAYRESPKFVTGVAYTDDSPSNTKSSPLSADAERAAAAFGPNVKVSPKLLGMFLKYEAKHDDPTDFNANDMEVLWLLLEREVNPDGTPMRWLSRESRAGTSTKQAIGKIYSLVGNAIAMYGSVLIYQYICYVHRNWGALREHFKFQIVQPSVSFVFTHWVTEKIMPLVVKNEVPTKAGNAWLSAQTKEPANHDISGLKGWR